MISTFTWVSILLLLIIIKYVFVLPREDKQIFELYEARDEISISAMRREISQDSREYEFVIDNINFWIYNTRNDYDFSVALSNIMGMARIKKGKLDEMLNNINAIPVLSNGLSKVSMHSQRIMRIKGMVFWNAVVIALKLSLCIARFFVQVCNIGHRTVENLNKKLCKYKKMKTQYDYYTKKVMVNKV